MLLLAFDFRWFFKLRFGALVSSQDSLSFCLLAENFVDRRPSAPMRTFGSLRIWKRRSQNSSLSCGRRPKRIETDEIQAKPKNSLEFQDCFTMFKFKSAWMVSEILSGVCESR